LRYLRLNNKCEALKKEVFMSSQNTNISKCFPLQIEQSAGD